MNGPVARSDSADEDSEMTFNLKALLELATPLTRERAKELIEADMAANAHRYPPASKSSEAMDSDEQLNADQDDPLIQERAPSDRTK
jgi:hypothetical protein